MDKRLIVLRENHQLRANNRAGFFRREEEMFRLFKNGLSAGYSVPLENFCRNVLF
jgi:hypothetical protein